jgi:hypothetical protein
VCASVDVALLIEFIALVVSLVPIFQTPPGSDLRVVYVEQKKY